MKKTNLKRLLKKAISWAGLFFFVIAAVITGRILIEKAVVSEGIRLYKLIAIPV